MCGINGIYPGLLSVGRYPASSCQSPMNAMCWPGSRVFSVKVFDHPAEPGALCLLRRVDGLVEMAGPIFSTNIFNLSLETKNSWLGRMDETLTAKNSALQPEHCIHWRLPDEGWIPAY